MTSEKNRIAAPREKPATEQGALQEKSLEHDLGSRLLFRGSVLGPRKRVWVSGASQRARRRISFGNLRFDLRFHRKMGSGK
jgi:hypothetical protein